MTEKKDEERTMLKKTTIILALSIVICSVFFAGCGRKDKKENNEPEKPDASVEETVKEKDYLSLETSIAYSSGDTKNWTYGNQRKEFPDNESCYVRIGSTAISTGTLGKGNGDSIEVTYRFTGTEKCNVEVSDGKATKVDTDDPNITEFKHTINAAKKKKAQEDIMIFRYSPKGAESVVLEVIYDDQIAEKYDEFNTVYFEQASDS